MRLSLNKVLAKALCNYRAIKVERGPLSKEEVEKHILCLPSAQVNSLAKALVDEINELFTTEVKRG